MKKMLAIAVLFVSQAAQAQWSNAMEDLADRQRLQQQQLEGTANRLRYERY
jgi:hypothetical protein